MTKKLIVLLGLLSLLSMGLVCSKEPSVPPNAKSTSPKPTAGIDPAEVDQAIQQIEKELGSDYGTTPGGVTPRGRVAYQEPFVMAGNISQRLFNRIKDGTIKRCSDAMYKDFFVKRPDYIIKVYLFKDAQTYEAYYKKTFGGKPSTPFGFYLDSSKSLIMNIGTGTGTLVHEMFHALVAPDFPDIPAWFNEGMGSLYEQCQIESNGSLRGLINWRYPTLKEAILSDKLVRLADLLKMDDDKFYGPGSDLHYAEARYFCMYLQEKGVLPEFYKTFRDNYMNPVRSNPDTKCRDAPSGGTSNGVKENDEEAKPLVGIKTLTKLLDKSLDEIEKEWKIWAVKLDEKK